jgi:hypothetical protein
LSNLELEQWAMIHRPATLANDGAAGYELSLLDVDHGQIVVVGIHTPAMFDHDREAVGAKGADDGGLPVGDGAHLRPDWHSDPNALMGDRSLVGALSIAKVKHDFVSVYRPSKGSKVVTRDRCVGEIGGTGGTACPIECGQDLDHAVFIGGQ